MSGILSVQYNLNKCGSKVIEIGISPENFEAVLWIYKQGFPKLQLTFREYYDIMSHSAKTESFFKSADASLYSADITISGEVKMRYVNGAHTKCVVLDRVAASSPADTRISGTQSVWLAHTSWQSLRSMRKLIEYVLYQRVRWQSFVDLGVEKILQECKDQRVMAIPHMASSELFADFLLGLEDTLYDLRRLNEEKNNEGIDHVQYYHEIIHLCSDVLLAKFKKIVENDEMSEVIEDSKV